MSRNNYSHSSRSAATARATIVATDRILSKEGQYKQDIAKINARCNLLADYISFGGTVESSLRDEGEDSNDPENVRMDDFMNEQRMKVKKIAEQNVHSKRYIEAYMAATNAIKSDIIRNSHNGNSQEEEEKEDIKAPDYESLLQTQLELAKHNVEKNSIAVKNDEFVRKICKSLNEKIASNADEDDDIQIEVTETNREAEMKCPLTAMLFQDPFRNKVCHHVYEKEAITYHLSMKKACPVTGCTNNHVTMSQLEPDEEMKIKVRRYSKAQSEKQRRNAMTQDYDVEDEEEEFDGGNGAGMTVIE
jgi:hypothetical protein